MSSEKRAIRHPHESPMVPAGIEVPYIAWEIQSTCNMGCEFCYSSSYNRFRRREALKKPSLQEIEEGLRKLADLDLGISHINWSGGEPLIRHSDLPAIFKSSRSEGFRNIVSTNGMFSVYPDIGHRSDQGVSRRRFQKYLGSVAEDLDWLAISWDSADSRVNNEVMRKRPDRVEGSAHHFDDVATIVGLYREMRPRFRLKVNTMVTGVNANESIKMLGEHFKGLNLVWKLIQFNPRECAPEHRSRYRIGDEEFEDIVAGVRQRYEGQMGFEGLRITSRRYDGSEEPYCFLVINTSGQILLPKGESHIVIGELLRKDDEFSETRPLRKKIVDRIDEELAGTETYGQAHEEGRLSTVEVFSKMNRRILRDSYGVEGGYGGRGIPSRSPVSAVECGGCTRASGRASEGKEVDSEKVLAPIQISPFELV